MASRRRFGMKPGLDTIRRVCDALGNPERRLRVIHIAGTNGKGATAAILDSCLRAAGHRVGLYTSPHLVCLNERFRIGGVPLDDATLDAAARRVFDCLRATDSNTQNSQTQTLLEEVTFFEALTAVAFLVFAEAGVDYVVLETGLGGRLDATNVCHPVLTVITRLGLDHCDWLGDTLEQIAAEKGGIIKPGVPVVLGANEPTGRAVIEDIARRVGAPFVYAPDRSAPDEIPSDFSLSGAFNRENALTALAALKVLGAGDRAGFGRVVWPGRFQRVGNFIIDGAHNPPAARALVCSLREQVSSLQLAVSSCGQEVSRPFRAGEVGASTTANCKLLTANCQRLTLIAGFCGDKDVDETLRILAPLCGRGLGVRTNNPRSLSAEAVAAKMNAVGIPAEPCASLRDAIARADCQQFNRSTIQPFNLICGSLFLAGEALVELNAYPWPAPRFDPSELLRATSAPR